MGARAARARRAACAAVGRPQQRARARRQAAAAGRSICGRGSASRRVGRLWLANGAVGTSGAGERFVEVDGRRYGHVIDPRTRRPGRRRARRERDHRRTPRPPTRCRRRSSSAGRSWRARYCAAHAGRPRGARARRTGERDRSLRPLQRRDPGDAGLSAVKSGGAIADAGAVTALSTRRVAFKTAARVPPSILARLRALAIAFDDTLDAARRLAAGAAVRARRHPRRQPLLHPADGRLGRHGATASRAT